ncbi:MAG TPA: substrate-binding domain-containing protein, partial [Candidatus Brocadiia bacterium]|nr:substrate-binding domain-containing protein [Candidatus Brocadiia bacterium]
LGHRRIALLIRPADQYFYGMALKGYQNGLADAGIPFDASRVVVCQDPDAVSAYVRVRDYLRDNPAPTALVAARDYLANGACQALVEKGLEIGRDVSVIGFDDTSWPLKQPFLTTFAEPNIELGRVAAEMLLERIIHGWQPVEKREVQATLILRKSAGPCLRDGGDPFPLALSARPWEPAGRA